MKKTILFLLLFVLNINALLAQITPTSTGTTTRERDAGSFYQRIDNEIIWDRKVPGSMLEDFIENFPLLTIQ